MSIETSSLQQRPATASCKRSLRRTHVLRQPLYWKKSEAGAYKEQRDKTGDKLIIFLTARPSSSRSIKNNNRWIGPRSHTRNLLKQARCLQCKCNRFRRSALSSWSSQTHLKANDALWPCWNQSLIYNSRNSNRWDRLRWTDSLINSYQWNSWSKGQSLSSRSRLSGVTKYIQAFQIQENQLQDSR